MTAATKRRSPPRVQREGLGNIPRRAAENVVPLPHSLDPCNHLPVAVDRLLAWAIWDLAELIVLDLAGEPVSGPEIVKLASEAIDVVVSGVTQALVELEIEHDRASLTIYARDCFAERALPLLAMKGGRA